jgi:hypothetical protein
MECSVLKNYMTPRALTEGKGLMGNPGGKAATPFPQEEVVMSIYGGPNPQESQRKLKLTSQVVNVVSPATPDYL